MKFLSGLLIAVSLMTQAMADESQQQLTISPLVSKNDLVGNYLNYVIDQSEKISESSDWILRRNKNLIAYERKQVSNVWEKNRVGEISYLQVYHDFKTYIEYYPADYRLLEQAEPEWQQLGALFDLEALKSLKDVDRYIVSGKEVTVYMGDLEGLSTTVHWVDALSLPLRIEYHLEDYRQVMELQSLYGNEDSPWPQWQRSDYFGIDFVDMGDNESHPLVQALNAGQAGGHLH